MFRTLISAAAIAVLAGCVMEPRPIASQDSRDLMIAQSAATATAALRELSETTGNSRVVTTKATSPASTGAVQDKQVASYIEPPKPQAPPMPQTIATRSGAIAMETLSVTPQQAPVEVVAAPASGSQAGQRVVYLSSSGVVASGGLLSVPPAGLEKLITVRWTGELEQLLLQVSREVGWTVSAPTGFRVVPVIISIQAENRSAFDVLRDIGAIAGTSADIRVATASRTISVNYPKR